jgi:acetyltransferase-like isoleucine patch superfamily enzyme
LIELTKITRNLVRRFEFYRSFIYPNFRNFKAGKISYKSKPRIEQLTICEGKGIVSIGDNCAFGYKLGGFNRRGSVELQARYSNSRIVIGNNVLTNNNVFICAANSVIIGDYSLIGQNVIMMDHEAHDISPEKRRLVGEIGEIIIGKNVWIGNNVSILKNSKIGNNSIIATGAVVCGVFPDNVIIGGIPAKIIKSI